MRYVDRDKAVANKSMTTPSPVLEMNTYQWAGKDKNGKIVKGQTEAMGEMQLTANLRRQGIKAESIRKLRRGRDSRITPKDIALFTRQLSTLLRSGVPMLQSFEIVSKGHTNPAVSRLLMSIKTDVEVGLTLKQAFLKHPKYFDTLYCNLVGAGETAGILDSLLDRLATYLEKTIAIKAQIKAALFYPTAVIVVAFLVTAVIMVFVVPQFKSIFSSFGTDLPIPTLIIIAISEFFVLYWWLILGIIVIGGGGFSYILKRNHKLQESIQVLSLKIPVFGALLRKSAIARWARTLATMFAAGVPLVEALHSVAGATGNHVYFSATRYIEQEVSTGSTLTLSMQNTGVFPNMAIQMTAIGEESGSLDSMLSKVADFFESEVDNGVKSISSLMEPFIMVILGLLIGGIVIAMYLPIFKLGSLA
jgi:type IV pilus assembly protein PilC